MVSINVPSNNNKISITTKVDNTGMSVSLQDVQSFAINKAKDWAEKMDGPIGNEGYSAKWHATQSAQSATEAEQSATNAQTVYEDLQEFAGQSLTDVSDAKTEAIDAISAASREFLEDEDFVTVATNIADIKTSAVNIEDINTNAENIEAIKDTATLIEHIEKKSMPVGTIYQAIRTDIPVGSLRLDGSEFTTGFDGFVTNYLATDKIICKSFAEWQTEYTMTNGNVGFFGYDEATGAFKTPCIQAGTFLAQAVASGEFGSFLNSELKSHNHSWGGTTSSNGGHTHTRGTQNITGSFQLTAGASIEYRTGAFYNGAAVTATQAGGTNAPTHVTAFNAANTWTGETSWNGEHAHTVSGTTSANGGSDTYPKHIRYPFFVVVSNVEAESPAQADWDNFVGNLDGKVNKSDMIDIKDAGILDSSNITNCLLEVPQRIKLELNNGVLTLKAGSELTYGDGRTIVIENGIAQTCQVNATLNNLILIHEPGSNGFGIYIQGGNATSGTTPPTIATGTIDYIWFDTNTNQMKISHDTQATWKEIPLPIGVVDITPYTYTAIKRVFNGIGHIDYTPFALPGIKCVASNGKNPDRTLKNVEFTTNRVLVDDSPDYTNRPIKMFLYPDRIESWGSDNQNVVYYKTRPSVAPVEYCTAYIEDENKWIRSTNSTAWTEELICAEVGDYRLLNGVITEFYPKQPFRAIDYSDKSTVASWAMPSAGNHIPLTLGTSNATYTAPANGYVRFAKMSTEASQFIYMSASVPVQIHSSGANQWLQTYLPVRKGYTFTVAYTAAGATAMFDFVPLEGDV